MDQKNLLFGYFSACISLIKSKLRQDFQDKPFSFFIDDNQINFFISSDLLFSKLTPAFGHLTQKTETTCLLDVYIVDEETVQLSTLPPPWDPKEYSQGSDLWVSDDSELKIIHQPSNNSLILLNLNTNQAIYWVKSGLQIPYYESSAPLRPILHWWMSAKGSQLLHAAAVGLPDRGALIVGKGGSGKSNTAISCLDSDLYYVADDYCLLSFKPYPKVFSLFSTAKLIQEDIKRYPFLNSNQLMQFVPESKEEKALFFLFPTLNRALINSFPIKAILIPKVAHAPKPIILPISSSKAYLALAPSTIFQMHGSKKQTHENISKLLRQVPSFSLVLSIDPKLNAGAILNFLKNL